MDFTDLIFWFNRNKRNLPWRVNKTFYRVWISEVMLQQTQVDTVIPFYLRFLKKFPDISHLANATIDDVLKLWEGLGYYSRARNMHKAAIELNALKKLPDNYDDLIKIPGFGPYTTAAVLSFTFNKAHAVVDGNVKRVISRLFLIDDYIDDKAVISKIQSIMDEHICDYSADDFNESIMELGALICKSKKPICQKCPMNKQCLARRNAKELSIPIKKGKKKIPIKKMENYIYLYNHKIVIKKRNYDEMLGGLWTFPSRKIISENRDEYSLPIVKHQYSHFKLELQCYLIKLKTNTKINSDEKWLYLKDIENYAFDKASLKVIDYLKGLDEDLIHG